jgi:hypothetical protein
VEDHPVLGGVYHGSGAPVWKTTDLHTPPSLCHAKPEAAQERVGETAVA